MELDVTKISGIGGFSVQKTPDGDSLYSVPDGKVFLVVRAKTYEVRTDHKLSGLLRERYETVMASRYFGKNGIEIIPSGQLTNDEIIDLVRLSYNLTLQEQ